jgi:hypothetical protein
MREIEAIDNPGDIDKPNEIDRSKLKKLKLSSFEVVKEEDMAVAKKKEEIEVVVEENNSGSRG